ncbi:hypothetical protein BC628DRAFT_159412 [Trametes gibbosa]|nr:hypothetical protein BC628DRAFT_159412 [Trametes gibbosa]
MSRASQARLLQLYGAHHLSVCLSFLRLEFALPRTCNQELPDASRCGAISSQVLRHLTPPVPRWHLVDSCILHTKHHASTCAPSTTSISLGVSHPACLFVLQDHRCSRHGGKLQTLFQLRQLCP